MYIHIIHRGSIRFGVGPALKIQRHPQGCLLTMVRVTGLEPVTSGLRNRCSHVPLDSAAALSLGSRLRGSTELHPRRYRGSRITNRDVRPAPQQGGANRATTQESTPFLIRAQTRARYPCVCPHRQFGFLNQTNRRNFPEALRRCDGVGIGGTALNAASISSAIDKYRQ